MLRVYLNSPQNWRGNTDYPHNTARRVRIERSLKKYHTSRERLIPPHTTIRRPENYDKIVPFRFTVLDSAIAQFGVGTRRL